jgi:hypothetical protein
MDTWLILFGVLLPLAPMLEMVDRHLDDSEQPAPVPVEVERRQPR